MPEYYYPPQQLNGELDSVYDTIRGLGGVLYIPAAHNGTGAKHQLVYPDDSTLAGTVGGTPTFDQGGLIPEILDGNPQATFSGSGDRISFSVPASDPLQMGGGGTWMYLLTPGVVVSVGFMTHKSSDAGGVTRQGFGVFFRSTGELVLATSDNTSTATQATSAAGVVVPGDYRLMTATLTGSGDAELYLNNASVGSGSSMQIPTDIASPLSVGNSRVNGRYVNGPVVFSAQFPTVLTQAQIANIASQCGPLAS